MNSVQNMEWTPSRVSAPPESKSISYSQVSNLFSRPLSDAADSLGVSTSELKKICYENGLVRWPYRKFLAGKSIEEIKKDAVIEKSQRLANPCNIVGDSSVQETSNSLNLQQPQSQRSKTSVSSNVLNFNLTRISRLNPDEFKYGFPSDGLSRISFRWWENSNSHDSNKKTRLSDSKEKQESENPVKFGCSEGDGSKNEIQTTTNDASRTISLSNLRNKAVKEGKAALKLGVYKGHGISKLDSNRRSVLVQIFKSSLPNQWAHSSA